MKELKDAFLLAKRDSNCKAVLLNSSGSYFCSGIDLSQLIGANKKQAADEMAATIKDLVITLGHFTKPVVAAVNGTTIGFGVSLLTFCDVILASDKATFSIPATRLGYLPEGGITLTLPQLVGAGVATEMLLHGRRLTAEQALRHGLVSEVLWPTHLMNEVMPRIQTIVSQPLSVMETLKSMVRCHLWDKLKSHVERECRLLPPFWLDAQCQHNIKRTLQTGWLVD
ncbi:Chromodomain Y-like protein, partial [Stegodyphus mimosarum]